MNLTEATDIAVDFVRERFGFAKPTAGKLADNKFLIETTHDVLDDKPRLVIEVSKDEGEEPKLVGTVGRYGQKHGKQVR